MTTVTPSVGAGADLTMPAPYRALRLLKRAGDVETIVAEDTRAPGSLVVIKRTTAASLGAGSVARLQHEAAVLGRLDGVAGPLLLASGIDGGQVWLAQRFVPGPTLQARLGNGPLSVDEALRVAGEVLAQLSQAHQLGVVHRDVKPANIILGPDPEGGTATLVDFGLARSAWLDPALREQAVGTARYAAPEQAGLIDRPVDQRCDLYALGVVLFECLAGRPPFDGSEVGTVLRQHLVMPAPDLRRAGVGVPRALAEVVGRLLRKEPSDRYQTAAAALADVEAIAAGRRAGVTDPPIVVGGNDHRATLTEPAYVGRAEPLAALGALLDAAKDGRGGLAVVSGESGSGKTRLLEELARAATDRGTWVLRGHGVDQAAQRPFQPFDGVAADAVTALAAQPEAASRLRERLGVSAQPVAAALPRLVPVLAERARPSMPEEYGEHRTLVALGAFLDALGTSDRPALVILDDCQWAPDVVAAVVKQWRRRRPRSGRRVMVVVAFRSEEVAGDSALQSLPVDVSVPLRPLTDAEVGDLVSSMAGRVPTAAVATVSRISRGNPFLAQAILRGMVECGALVRTAQGWGLDPLSHGEIQASRQAALVLMRRLDLLSPTARRLLTVGATLGKEFDLNVAVSLSGLSAADATAGIDDALRRRILWVDDAGGRGRFLHDKLREAVLGRLDPGERQAVHLEAARALQAHAGAASVFDLAYHFDAAGHAAEALPFALSAAEQARSQHALDIAETNYLIAARGTTDRDRGLRAQVAEGLGDILALRGRYAEAQAQLEQAVALTDEPLHQAALDGKLGDLAFRRGEQGKACELLEGALRRLGVRVPRRRLGNVPGLVWALIVQVVHTAFPSRIGRSPRPPLASETLTMRLYSRLAYAYWFRSGTIACGWAHLRGMNLAERFPPSEELAQAYSEHAPVMTMIPWYSRGIAYAHKSLAIRTELGDVWGQGQSLHFLGVVLYAASRFRESLARCEEAIRLLSRTGDQWETNTAIWHAAFAHYRLGEMAVAAALSAQLHADAVEIGDQAAAGIALSCWSRATDGRLPAAVVAAELTRSNEDVHTATEVRLAEAVRQLAQGRPGAAVEVLDQARREVRRARLRQEYVAPVLPWLATALRAQAETLPPAAARRASSRALRRRRRTVTRGATRMARSYRNNLPHALREQALCAAAEGRLRRAHRLLDRSISVAEEQDAAYEASRSRAERGRVGLALGWPGAAADVREAQAAISRLAEGTAGDGAEGPARGAGQGTALVSMARKDQFAALLNAGREIAAATSIAAVRQAVHDAAWVILHAERCYTFEVNGDQPVPVTSGSDDPVDDMSHTLISEAITTGRTVVATAGLGNQVADSLELAGVRSALCAPISRGGKVVACLYVTHRDVADTFGDEEQRLAGFIAAVAGAALEHVAGSDAHFRALVRNSHDLTIVTDATGRTLYVSPSITRILGYAPTDLTRLDGHLIHRADAEKVVDAFRLCRFSPATRPTAEFRTRHRDGSWRWLEATLSNLLADLSIRGIVFNIRDITDRKRAELALGQASEQFRLSFENAPIGMALTSTEEGKEGWLLKVNQALADMLGYTRSDLERHTDRQLTHPDDLPADEEAMLRFQTNQTSSSSTDKRYRHSDGHWIWVHLQTSMVHGDAGPPKYVISQMLDITERRAAEQRLTFLALHDPLTGLANRRLLLDRLVVALARTGRTGKKVGLLYLDLDRFKAVNDTWGHEMGDQLLLQAATRLGDLVRDSDTLARLGGDEFVLVAEDLDTRDEALSVARRIEDSFSQPFELPHGIRLTLSVSVGVALAGTGADPDALLRQADNAMYQAKSRGRACYQLYEDDAAGAGGTQRD